MVRILLKNYPLVLKRFAQVIQEDLPKKTMENYLINVVETMKGTLKPYSRKVLPLEQALEGHFEDSLYYKVEKGIGYVGSNYPRKPAEVARAIDEGRSGYEAVPPRKAIRVVKPTGEEVFRRKVGPSKPHPFIYPSFFVNRGILGLNFVKGCREMYYASAKEYEI